MKAHIYGMAGKGSAPGERRGGRRKGVPNKATLKREAAIAAKRSRAGLKLAKDVMSEAMNYFRGLAGQYQPKGDQPDEKKFEKYLKLAADIAKDLAPYESPRLATTTHAGDPDKPIMAKVQVEYV